MGERHAPLAGHGLRISETNTRGYVPVCACGWSGNVHPTTKARWRPDGVPVRNRTKALAAALRDHTAHLDDVRARRRVAVTPKLRAIVDRPGRFPHA